MNQFAAQTGAILDFPYSNSAETLLDQLFNGLGSVASQGLLNSNGATISAAIAIMTAALEDAGSINIFTFSGGAQAFQTALQDLPPSVVNRINNVTYVSPGAVSSLTGGSGQTTVIQGNSLLEILLSAAAVVPLGTNFIFDSCGHDANCHFRVNRDLLLTLAGNPCSDAVTISPVPQKSTPIASPLPFLGTALYDLLFGGDFTQEEVSSTITFGQIEDVLSTITYNLP